MRPAEPTLCSGRHRRAGNCSRTRASPCRRSGPAHCCFGVELQMAKSPDLQTLLVRQTLPGAACTPRCRERDQAARRVRVGVGLVDDVNQVARVVRAGAGHRCAIKRVKRRATRKQRPTFPVLQGPKRRDSASCGPEGAPGCVNDGAYQGMKRASGVHAVSYRKATASLHGNVSSRRSAAPMRRFVPASAPQLDIRDLSRRRRGRLQSAARHRQTSVDANRQVP
jgi:hypothetical protein